MNMRELTEEELKLAPDWATHYRCNSSEIIFESKNQWMAIGFSFPFIKRGPFKHQSKLTKCKSIPEFKAKSFDITKHEFSDTVQHVESDGCELSLYCVDGFRHVELYKDDAIAIAKALGVAGDDLL